MADQDESYEVVRASGICVVCDSRFVDEFALRIRDSALPGGWAYIELRHVQFGQPAGRPSTRAGRTPHESESAGRVKQSNGGRQEAISKGTLGRPVHIVDPLHKLSRRRAGQEILRFGRRRK